MVQVSPNHSRECTFLILQQQKVVFAKYAKSFLIN